MTKNVVKKKLNVKRLSTFILACFAVVIAVTYICSLVFRKDTMPEIYKASHFSMHEGGTPSYNQKIAKNYYIAMHYPTTNKQKINQDISAFINTEIDSFKEIYSTYKPENEDEKMVLSLDYESTAVANKYISVIFYRAIAQQNEALNYQMIATRTYDLETGEIVDLDVIFQGAYLEKIAGICRNEWKLKSGEPLLFSSKYFIDGTAATIDNYEYYIFSDQVLRVYFEPAQVFNAETTVTYVDIPIFELAYFLETEFPASTIIQPTTIDQNIVRYVDPSKPMIAITFDDGPLNGVTTRILETLKVNSAKATFFVVGSRVSNHGDLINAIVAGGNEIGNHTYHHQALDVISRQEILNEINMTNDKIAEYSDITIELLRPVNGVYNKLVLETVPYPLIMWNVDPRDWSSNATAENVYTHIMENVKDGAIIICHDLYESTADAVELFVPELIAQGYQLVTISELAEYRGYLLEPGNAYGSFPPKEE